MRGCDKFCTFCVVPFTRGRERSLPPEAVVAQVEASVAAGKREVVFLGQTVNAYRFGDVDFGGLLRLAARVPGLERIRFTSPHPSEVSDSMIEALASEPRVMPYLHLPLQSASDPILSVMQRDYTIDQYRALLARVRERVPGIAVSTDIIVGFPGETEDDYRAPTAWKTRSPRRRRAAASVC
jgi:tRNA-2-methylthio-N6-dimethylallyladenosine synthase